MVPFKDLRESRGFDVTMVRCSEIPGGCGSTTSVKAYIQDAYDNWPVPPSYVLLVGDTNTIATWSGPTIGTSTDLYYGTMDGTSDWHPDIGRGRFPVRSPQQTTYMVDKYLAYADLTGQEPWVKEASFPATCDLYTVAEGTHNYVIDTYTAPKGYTGHFPNDPQPGGDKLYCITYDATRTDLIEAFNNGRWAIIYSGHGSHSGWEMSFTSTDVQNLTNYGIFPFVASHACVSGDFGQTEVFGETWVLQQNKGALVYWGSSTNSFWDEDDVLERAMFDSLFSETEAQADVAAMTDDGLAAVEAAYPSSARYYRETYNVLGDPAVKLFLEPDLPTFTLDVDPQEYDLCKSGTVTSTVTIGSIHGYSETVYLEAGPLPLGITATFGIPLAQAPFTTELTIDVADMPAGDYPVVVTATDQMSWTHEATVDVRVVRDEPAAPVLASPPDGAVDQPFTPTFDWDPAAYADSYHLQLARSPLFETPIVDASGIVDHQYTPASPLEGGLCYWWRVAGENVCTPGEWAIPFHFSTVALATSFYDDVEAGAGNWTHQADQGIDHWQISDRAIAQPHAGLVRPRRLGANRYAPVEHDPCRRGHRQHPHLLAPLPVRGNLIRWGSARDHDRRRHDLDRPGNVHHRQRLQRHDQHRLQQPAGRPPGLDRRPDRLDPGRSGPEQLCRTECPDPVAAGLRLGPSGTQAGTSTTC